MKKRLSLFIAIAIILCAFPLNVFAGNCYIEFGSYPQSLVTDTDLIEELNTLVQEWISYGYYSGDGKAGSETTKDYMKYADVEHNGNKYRAVLFTEYRPVTIYGKNTSGNQYSNGYNKNNIYWFEFEPLKWRLIDRDEGLFLCDSIIDSQPFNAVSGYYMDDEKTIRANNYVHSTIREWLNNDFYNTAFSAYEQSIIETSEIENKLYDGTYEEVSPNTFDKIFLLSVSDMLNSSYGFSTDIDDYDMLRKKTGSDYAKCQGLDMWNQVDSYWYLRTARLDHGASLNTSCGILYNGEISDRSYLSVNSTDTGIVPALRINKDNVGIVFGECGNYIKWTFNFKDNSLIFDGTGSFPDEVCGWTDYSDIIEYVEISDGITSIDANAFNDCRELKEVYLGKDVTDIGENAFADCTNLSIVSVTSDSLNAEKAFKNNNSKLTFVISEGNAAAESFAENNGYSIIIASRSADNNTIDFQGNTVVYKGLEYNYLTNYINEYSDAKYIHFDRLEFDGVMPDVILIEDCENIASGVKNFALDDLYVSLKVVIDGQEEQITFEKMFELLESGNYDAFKLKFNSESGETEESFFEKIEEFFVGFYTSAIRVITKAINFVVGLFKKK